MWPIGQMIKNLLMQSYRLKRLSIGFIRLYLAAYPVPVYQPYVREKEYRRETVALTHEQFLDGDGKAVFRRWNE